MKDELPTLPKELLEQSEEQRKARALKKRGSRTSGQYAADMMTEWMGSWTFIIVFLIVLGAWIALNILAWLGSWDPYPFILLNLVLSSLTAFQAPIILMSQNRQAERDRVMARYDYDVDRKAEREIRDMQADFEEIKKMLREIKDEIKK